MIIDVLVLLGIAGVILFGVWAGCRWLDIQNAGDVEALTEEQRAIYEAACLGADVDPYPRGGHQ